MNSRTLIAWAALAAAALGILRGVSVYFWKAGPLRTTRADDRFRGLLVPPGERAGFVTDATGGDATRRYYETLYALAPAVVLQDAGRRLVVADVVDPAAIARICRERGLRVAQSVSPGVALLERR